MTYFANIAALHLVDRVASHVDKVWNNTEAENLYNINYKNSLKQSTIDE